MQNNFYFLRKLSEQLGKLVVGFRLVSCFSQQKEELVIELNDGGRSVVIRATCSAHFSCISFPENFKRARKNSVDLFPEIILKKVTGVRQFENERCFAILLEENLALLFKMHGNRSNVVVMEDGKASEIFLSRLPGDLAIQADTLDRQIDWSKEHFQANLNTLQKSYFTFGKVVWEYLVEKEFEQKSMDERWELIQHVREKLENPEYLLCEKDGRTILSLLPIGKIITAFQDPLSAANSFYNAVQSSDAFAVERNAAFKILRKKHEAATAFISKTRKRLSELETDRHFQEWADLIMANMDSVKKGMTKITLKSLYDDHHLVEIPLKENLNAQRNAEVYYRKSKNSHIEIKKLQEGLVEREKELSDTETLLTRVEQAQDLKTLRAATEGKSTGVPITEKKPDVPYKEYIFKDFRIWVGKNADHNDELTLKFSYKEDLWLHAKDVPGSHVLIKHQSGKNFPKDVIERAAELAAYYSKRRNDSMCPVAMTPKKFVRKRKGSPAGSVIVEKETTILVTPKS